MPRRIVIGFDPHPERMSHKVYFFAKDLWRACQDGTDGYATLPLADALHVTDRLVVGVGSAKRVRRIVRMIEDLLQDHHLACCARVVVEAAE